MQCPRCAKEIREPGAFCPHCAAALGDAVTSGPTELGAGESPTPDEAPTSADPPLTPTPLSLSDSGQHGRFLPGTTVADRYRIVGLLGRGGMGEVYRADDLKLGQQVALKFLPRRFMEDEGHVERLFDEVRMARKVSHPNVCRVWDIGEADGQHYVSMEYVDGEDLASLLRRIGRLPKDKAVEISRQLCAALAAAHDEGVLHRDLKPANIMLDGRGRVKLTDFGLAAVAEVRAGTPIYMAPEQLAGEEVSVKSDLYALGLVLHELFTGDRVFDAGDLEELKRQHEHSMTETLTMTSDLDPAVERVIGRCLRADPGERPGSALVVAAGLPGADPLAAALAAGETPSPEIVAEAGGEGKLRAAIAIPLLVVTVLGALAFATLNSRTTMVSWIPFDTPPQVLEASAQEIVANLGYTQPPVDRASGFIMDLSYPQWLDENTVPLERYEALREGRPAVGIYWWRSSPRLMIPSATFMGAAGLVTRSEPAVNVPGMILVTLDLRGRLRFLEVVPDDVVGDALEHEEFEWAKLFDAAGLDMAGFQPVSPRFTPRRYADERMAWEGVFPEDENVALHIEAAAFRGRPVMWRYFSTFAPMESSANTGPDLTIGMIVFLVIFMTVIAGVMLGSIFLARRNVRLGRGDRRGAGRFGTFLILTLMLGWLFKGDHVANLSQINMFFDALVWAVAVGGLGWALYLAVEPIMRRHDPERMIGWSRLLNGRFDDPLVGRDLLFGCVAGVCVAGLGLAEKVAGLGGLSRPSASLVGFSPLQSLSGPAAFISGELGRSLPLAAASSLGILLLYALILAAVRRRWAAMAIMVTFFSLIDLTNPLGFSPLQLAIGVVGTLVMFSVLVRFGVLAAAVATWTQQVFVVYLVTLDLSIWYAPNVMMGLALFLAVACYGFYRSVEWKGGVTEAWLES